MLQCSLGYCTEINLLLYNLKRSLSTGCCVKCRASEKVQPLQFWMAAELPVNPCHGAVAKKLCFQGCWSLDGCCKHFAILMALRVNKPILCDTFRESMQLPYPLIYHNRPYDSSCTQIKDASHTINFCGILRLFLWFHQLKSRILKGCCTLFDDSIVLWKILNKSATSRWPCLLKWGLLKEKEKHCSGENLQIKHQTVSWGRTPLWIILYLLKQRTFHDSYVLAVI